MAEVEIESDSTYNHYRHDGQRTEDGRQVTWCGKPVVRNATEERKICRVCANRRALASHTRAPQA